MENCPHCSKEYTKCGITRHINKCTAKSSNLSQLSLCASSVTPIQKEPMREIYLPNECLLLIKEFCVYKDKFMSNKAYYRCFFHMSFVNKQFYEIFALDNSEYRTLSVSEENETICKMDAKDKYGLTEKDFRDMDYTEKYHRFYRITMKLFSLSDVMDKARLKHGSHVEFVKQQEIKKEKARKRKELLEREKRRRRMYLTYHMETNGLRVRADSVLCNDYIERNIGTIDEIVAIMLEMDFYFKYTTYEREYSRERRSYYDYHHYYRSISEEDRIDISALAKRRALTAWCSRFSDSETALSNTYLPASLREKVVVHFTRSGPSVTDASS